MLELIQFIVLISCLPIIGLSDVDFGFFVIYCAIQIIALLIAYFLRKKGLVTSCSPFAHYILTFIIGHVVYIVIGYWLFMKIFTFFIT
jgi:putative flippase GtrA